MADRSTYRDYGSVSGDSARQRLNITHEAHCRGVGKTIDAAEKPKAKLTDVANKAATLSAIMVSLQVTIERNPNEAAEHIDALKGIAQDMTNMGMILMSAAGMTDDDESAAITIEQIEKPPCRSATTLRCMIERLSCREQARTRPFRAQKTRARHDTFHAAVMPRHAVRDAAFCRAGG